MFINQKSPTTFLRWFHWLVHESDSSEFEAFLMNVRCSAILILLRTVDMHSGDVLLVRQLNKQVDSCYVVTPELAHIRTHNNSSCV